MAEGGLAWMFLWYFGLTVASAVFPWVNAELIVLSFPAVAPSRGVLLLLVLIATAGQMTGKCVVYWAGRKGKRVLPGRAGRALEKLQERLAAARPSRVVALVLISAIVGFPPFFLMTIVAGAVKMNFLAFLTAGTTGRLVRFGFLAMLPQLALSLFKGGA